MRILDRERFWAFAKAYVICFVVLLSLYLIVDVLMNIDEFSQPSDSALKTFGNMGWYYLIKMRLFLAVDVVLALLAALVLRPVLKH